MATQEERSALRRLLGFQDDSQQIPDALADSCVATASRIVTEQLSQTSLTEDAKSDIKRYLGAHFAAITVERGTIVSERIGQSAATYGYAFGKGLEMTRYGMTVLSLDTSGTLAANATSQPRAEFVVV